MAESRKLSEGKFNVVLTIGIVLGILAVGVIIWYVQNPAHREGLRFALMTFTAAAGITTAYYVAASLRETTAAGAKSLEESARSELISRTFEYSRRWGDPAFESAKEAVRKIIREIHGDAERGQKIKEAIANDDKLERSLISTMNFLEELAFAIHEGVVDADMQKRLFRGTVTRYFETLRPWVEQSRDLRGDNLYVEVEKLYDLWK